MNQEDALKIARNWYNSRPDEQQATMNYLNETKDKYTKQMAWMIVRIEAINTLIVCLKGQSEDIPEVFLKAFKEK